MRDLRQASNLYKNTNVRSSEFADVFVEFENAKISRQEIGLFMSVVARMVDHLGYKEIDSESGFLNSEIGKEREMIKKILIES